SQPGELALYLPSAEPALASSLTSDATPSTASSSGLSAALLQELWLGADAESCGLTREEFATALIAVGTKHHFGHPSEISPALTHEAAFYRALRLPELALAQA